VAVRVEGWRGFVEAFGGLAEATTPYAARGYFENEGQIAQVVRVAGPSDWACVPFVPGDLAGNGVPFDRYLVTASSAGEWGNGGSIAIVYRRDGLDGHPEIAIEVRIDGEPTEFLEGLHPGRLPEEVAARSRLIRVFEPVVAPSGPSLAIGPPVAAPRAISATAVLGGGRDVPRSPASAVIDLTSLAGDGLPWARYRTTAHHSGPEGNGVSISVEYLRLASGEAPFVRVRVDTPAGAHELIDLLPAATWFEDVSSRSKIVSVVPVVTGPRWAVCPNLYLAGGTEAAPHRDAYLSAVTALQDQPDVAIVALPDLHPDALPSGGGATSFSEADGLDVLAAAIVGASELHDRLVLVDLPRTPDARAQTAWLDALGALTGSDALRDAAAYHPWIDVPEERRAQTNPTRVLPSSGHVAGLISRLDRERGAHHTPANATLREAVDVDDLTTEDNRLILAATERVNLLRCAPSRGIVVWGGRTLDPEGEQPFVAHRRLVHRIVRAARRVAEPLVFDSNGPELWLSLVRAITALLLEAYRGGALKGERPEEAFRVRCDESTNPGALDSGRCVCEIEVAPAAPMEFIVIRVALSADGTLEVLS